MVGTTASTHPDTADSISYQRMLTNAVNERAPWAFVAFAALLLVLVPSFGCGLAEREGEEQTTAPSQTAVVSTRRPPCQELSPTQEKIALKLIDDICGDTWCEGDYNF